jgi:hypothetical protein
MEDDRKQSLVRDSFQSILFLAIRNDLSIQNICGIHLHHHKTSLPVLGHAPVNCIANSVHDVSRVIDPVGGEQPLGE